MKEKKPVGHKTRQKHIHTLAVYNKNQVHVMDSTSILPFPFSVR